MAEAHLVTAPLSVSTPPIMWIKSKWEYLCKKTLYPPISKSLNVNHVEKGKLLFSPLNIAPGPLYPVVSVLIIADRHAE